MATCVAQANMVKATGPGLQGYLQSKIEGLEFSVRDRSLNLKRLEAQRNNLNSQGARPVMEPHTPIKVASGTAICRYWLYPFSTCRECHSALKPAKRTSQSTYESTPVSGLTSLHLQFAHFGRSFNFFRNRDRTLARL